MVLKITIRLVALLLITAGAVCADPAQKNVLTLGFPGNIESVEFGHLSFGIESPRVDGAVTGLTFTVKETMPGPEGGTIVFGLTQRKGIDEVWRAATADGRTFTDSKLLYQLPEADTTWLKGKMTRTGDQLLLMQCQKGSGGSGHSFHAFGGSIDGSGWQKLKPDPVFSGQDAYCISRDDEQDEYIAYLISFQPWLKHYPDNMPAVRRVLHIRTSHDGLTWTPSNSFGVGGPYLPAGQLIVPDEKDAPDDEFYNFSVINLGEFWLGAMTHYVSQPAFLPRPGSVRHGPFSRCEWWISKDGLEWDRPFREDFSLDAVPYNFANHLYRPMVAGDDLCWAIPTGPLGKLRYVLNRRRMCYAYGRENIELVTKPFKLSGAPITLDVSYESVRRGAESFLFQGYVMAELLDEQGQVIAGFEREKCVFNASEASCLPLVWNGNILPDSSIGRTVSLRLLSRDTRLYSISH